MNEVRNSELEQKRDFALALLRDPTQPYIAGISVFGDDTGKALFAARYWIRDPDVKQFMQDAIDAYGEEYFLPTKADLARKVWSMATSENMCVDDKLKAFRLYADVRGFIDKGAGVVVNNNLTSNKVMLVRDHGDDAEWEQRCVDQQTTLIQEANASFTKH